MAWGPETPGLRPKERGFQSPPKGGYPPFWAPPGGGTPPLGAPRGTPGGPKRGYPPFWGTPLGYPQRSLFAPQRGSQLCWIRGVAGPNKGVRPKWNQLAEGRALPSRALALWTGYPPSRERAKFALLLGGYTATLEGAPPTQPSPPFFGTIGHRKTENFFYKKIWPLARLYGQIFL